MKNCKLFLLMAAAVLFIRTVTGAPLPNYTARDFSKITSMTSLILERNHYSRHRMNRELSAKIFDTFMDQLDPWHIMFTAEDIQQFASERNSLGFKLRDGEHDFAFKVYAVFRRRFNEYCEFTRKMLASKVDFTGDETFEVDRKKLPRPANEAEMHDLWRRKVKSDLLLLRLIERAGKEKKNSDAAKDKKTPAVKTPPPVERLLRRQRDVANDVNKRDRIDILGILLDSMASSYGAHSNYQPPKQSEDFEIHMSLSLTGIGATLTTENGYIKIVELVSGGPAAKSGKIKVNDRIVSVTQENGETIDLIDMPVSKAVQYIRGKKGSRLTLSIIPGHDDSAHPVNVTLVRDKINLVESAAKGEVRTHKDPKTGKNFNIGVLTIPSFYMDFAQVHSGNANARRASTDVRKIMEDFNRKKVDSVVIDLRNNGGGSLPDAIVLSGLFLPGGPVVQVNNNYRLDVENDKDPGLCFKGPLVVLTNKFSASAAEIFSGALRDADRALIVGDSRTFGKGTVLAVETLDKYTRWFGSGKPSGVLTFETAMFYRPNGSSVQQLGIAPDVTLPSLTEEMDAGEMFLDNHLPWDQVKPVKRLSFDPALGKKAARIRAISAARIKQDPQYAKLLKYIEIYRRTKKRKVLSLNEEKRWQDYRRERQATEAAEKLFEHRSESGNDSKEKYDPVLDEAVRIAADLFRLDK